MPDWQFIRLRREEGAFSLVEVGEAPDRFWFQVAPQDRQQAASQYVGLSLTHLNLSTRSAKALKYSRRYPDIATLMMAGPELLKVRNLGMLSAREIHAALEPLFGESLRAAAAT